VPWFEETLYPDYRQAFHVRRTICRLTSGHQEIVIFETERFGRVLALDGVIQTTEADEFVYHEMLAHVPLFAHGRARRVLIVGGGDGGMLEEVLKHPVERVTLVEIDRRVIELCRTYLPSISRDAFDDPRAEVVIADAGRYVAATDARFDVVIVDSPDPVGPAAALFEAPFYAGCKRCLAQGGVLVAQNGVPFMQGDELSGSIRHLRGLFADVAAYVAPVPTYVGGVMAFAWASDDRALRQAGVEVLQARAAKAGIETRYYTPDVHRAAFALPPYVENFIV